MAEECVKCDKRTVVGVLDKNIERKSTGGGNKFRRYCLACEAWRKMCSEDRFRRFERKYVLPLDGSSENAPASLVRLSEYDYEGELDELLEEEGICAGATTDGGDVEVEHDSGRVREFEIETDQDEEDQEDEGGAESNRFYCPQCGSEQTGYPDSCRECGAVYDW